MASLSQKRTEISKAQRVILIEFYEDGMQGVAKENRQQFQQAVEATGLPPEVVRGWIGNQNRERRKTKTHKRKAVSGVPTGSNGYQLFCSKVAYKSGDAATRLREWKKLWWALTHEDRAEWNRQAKENKKRKVSDLTVEEREHEIEKCTKVLSSTFAKLDALEANGLCVVEKTNATFGCSSAEGTKVLKENLNKIEDQFVIAAVEKKKAKKKKKSDQEKEDLRTRFAEKMNGLYAAFIGKQSKFPYGKYDRKEVDFIIRGLPSGIKFKAGSLCSLPDMRAVLDADLQIVGKEQAINLSTVETPAIYTSEGADEEVLRVTQSSIPIETDGPVNDSDHEAIPLYGLDGEVIGVVHQPSTSPECDEEIMPASELMEKMKVAGPGSKGVAKKKKKGLKKITTYLERL